MSKEADDRSIEEILEQIKHISNIFEGKSDDELMEITAEDLYDYQLKFLKGQR